MVGLEFLRLKINCEYNFSMGDVDVADQLQKQYYSYHCLWNFKLWWPIFLWVVQVIVFNAYVLYAVYMYIEGVEKKGLLSHYEFRKYISLACPEPEK